MLVTRENAILPLQVSLLGLLGRHAIKACEFGRGSCVTTKQALQCFQVTGEEEEWVSKRRMRGWASSKRRRRRRSNSRKGESGGGEACGWREGRRREIQISNF